MSCAARDRRYRPRRCTVTIAIVNCLRSLRWTGMFPALVAWLGCSARERESLHQASEDLSPGQFTFTLTFPPGVSPAEVAMAASGTLNLGDRLAVTKAGGGIPTVVNTG